ncbi:uncharacterized protein LOC118418512 isoform X2 [Branchiostoma floridae]|uniref:Uncharacterized protein LOC118418512 isoform X2 n=1 Tax=Branchiostoma floridae TaxID=7739 RepID=A0A9J7LDV9_BRAFL|nr:uncharacterized protein LOC118418512 isoform X2 [Branchiostoma floridae]
MEENKPILDFLQPLGLETYVGDFRTRGFTEDPDFQGLTQDDLDSMNITDEEHRDRIVAAAAVHEVSEEHQVLQFLREHGLEYYFTNFLASEYTDLEAIERMDTGPATFDDLEITLPSHKNRLTKAVNKLRKRQRVSFVETEAETAIAYGYWSRPAALEGAICDFLCVKATIKSPDPNGQSVEREFLVDSGSDVVTIKSEILDQLKLPKKGDPVQSKGVHATVKKQLHSGIMVIGSEEIHVEVISHDGIESIGCVVMQKFRHFITPDLHIWLGPVRRSAQSPGRGATATRGLREETPVAGPSTSYG